MKFYAATIAILIEVNEEEEFGFGDAAELLTDGLNDMEGTRLANWGYTQIPQPIKWPDDYWTEVEIDPHDAYAWDCQEWITELEKKRGRPVARTHL